MTRLPFRSDSHLAAAVMACRTAFDRHGVVAIPTETFYGLAVRPDDAAAVEALYALKGRPAEKALPLVVADFAQAEELAVFPPVWAMRLAEVWPAPLSVVAPVRRPLAACRATAAVRVPAHRLLRALLRELGPLTATSANPSGGSAPCSPEEVEEGLGSLLALLLDGGPTPGGAPSTLLDLGIEPPKLLRRGAFELPAEWLVRAP